MTAAYGGYRGQNPRSPEWLSRESGVWVPALALTDSPAFKMVSDTLSVNVIVMVTYQTGNMR